MLIAAVAATVAACASGDGDSTQSGDRADGNRPRVVVSTTIWADVVEQSVGDLVEVSVVIPNDADPHFFAPSARQAAELEDADLIVVNGAGLEAGLDDAVESAEGTGVPVFRVVDHVETRTIGPHEATDDAPGEDGHGEDGHNEDGHDDGHAHDGIDPHVWFDPTLVHSAVEALAARLDDGLTDGAVEASAPYLDMLASLDAEISERIDTIPADQRKLVTNHDSFGYYAERYGLEVIDTLVRSVTSDAQPSAAEIAEVAEVVKASGVAAVFVETNGATDLAQAVIDETGANIAVVALHTESLGSTDSYVEMMRFDTDQIVAGLTGETSSDGASAEPS